MKINLINITDQFLSFWEDCQDLSVAEQKIMWEEMYYQNNKELLDIYFKTFGDKCFLDQALKWYPLVIDYIKSGVIDIEKRIDRIVNFESTVFQKELDDEINVVVMIGVFNSNGWVTEYKGKETIFVALEMFKTTECIDIIIAHEMAHFIYHEESVIHFGNEPLGIMLFDEGLATFISQLTFPDENEIDHLWFGMDFLDLKDWQYNVEKYLDSIKEHIMKDLDKSDTETKSLYFYMNLKQQETKFPVRVGYYIGLKAISILNQNYTIKEMVKWTESEILTQMYQAIEEIK